MDLEHLAIERLRTASDLSHRYYGQVDLFEEMEENE